MKKRAKLAALLLAAAGLPLAGASSTPALKPLRAGTVHDALFAVSFDAQQGLAVGAAGAVFASSDGGKSWQEQAAPTPLSLLGVSSSAGRTLAVGQYGLVLRREGSGAWQQAESGSKQRLFAVSLNSHGQAVAVGAFGTVLHSEDAGKTWQAIAPDWTPYTTDGAQPHLYAASIDESGSITIAGEFGLLLRRQGDAPWQLLHKGDASLFGMNLDAQGGGYIVGQSGCVLHSEDGGKSWQTLDVGSQAILLNVRQGGDGLVLITGMRDAVYSRDAGKSWQRLSDPRVASSWYAGLARSEQGALVAVGSTGQIVSLQP